MGESISMKKRGLFLSFEGTDGCGKSTQMRFLKEYLESCGYPVTVTREPGGCPLSEKIRDLLLDVQNADMQAETEALLYAAARVQHIETVILPALREGRIVLCDRYLDSSLAYQGVARGLGFRRILEINRYAVDRCMPDYTFFLDFEPEDAFLRMNPDKQPDRLEQEGEAFFHSVYRGFLQIVQADPKRVIRVDVSGSKFETRAKMREIMEGLLKKWEAQGE